MLARLCQQLPADALVVLSLEDLAATVVATCLADRVRPDHRTAVGATNELRPLQGHVGTAIALARTAQFSFRICHVRSVPVASAATGTRFQGRKGEEITPGPDEVNASGRIVRALHAPP